MSELQFSEAVRNARLNAIETTIGTSPKLRIYTGPMPASCASVTSGTLLHTLTLPSDWMAAASGGEKVKAGTWSGTAAVAGTAGHYRIYDSANTTCHEQGSITLTGGGGAATMDNLDITIGQIIAITKKTVIDGNA